MCLLRAIPHIPLVDLGRERSKEGRGDRRGLGRRRQVGRERKRRRMGNKGKGSGKEVQSREKILATAF